MEKKTRHRLLGMIIVIALVVLCLPFMQQQPEVSANVIATTKTSALVAAKEIEPIVDTTEAGVEPEQPVVATPVSTHHTTTKIPETRAPIQQTDNTEPPEPHHVESKSLQHEDEVRDDVESKPSTKISNPSSRIAPIATTERSKPIIRDNGLFDIKEKVWVIQIGSFSNKAQAIQLTKKMRATQHAVFMQQMNRRTHLVFVGPELTQQSAQMVADSLQRDHHVRAIVVSYKPLT